MRSVRIHGLLLVDQRSVAARIEQLLSEVQDLRYSLEWVSSVEESSSLDMRRFDIVLGEIHPQDSSWVSDFRSLYPSLPIIAMTRDEDHALGLRAIREGAHDYLSQQGLTADTLLRTLRYTQERSRVERTLKLSQAQLFQAQKMEAVGRTVSGLAHQFRQSVQVILSNCSTLKVMHSEDEETQDLTQEIKGAIQDANRLVDQVFSFAQPTRSRAKCSLNQAILEHETMLESLATGVQLRMELAPASPTIGVPKAELGQLLLNLVSNSVDACRKGGWVQLHSRLLNLDHEYIGGGLKLSPGSYAVLSVSDSGAGIKPEVGARMFEPFFTTKTKNRGTGLGLSTVFSLCQQHRIGVDFQTQHGMGTVFRLVFPIDRLIQTEVEKPVFKGVILIWNCDTAEQLTLRRLLEGPETKVLEVNSWRDLEQVKVVHPSAVLLIDGLTYWQEIARNSLEGALPKTVILSEWPVPIASDNVSLARLASPFSRTELLAILPCPEVVTVSS